MIAAMKIINNPADMPSGLEHTVVAIGNFDGVHLGHQALLQKARDIADQRGWPLLVLTFEPHPRQFFQPDIKPFRITPASVKAQVFENLVRPDFYVSMDFDSALASLSSDEFINDVLVGYCRAKTVIIGQDFRFGKGRCGNVETLRSCGAFETLAFDVVTTGGQAVSSSRVRDCLQNADIAQANTLLGWEWYIESEVIHGDKRGREMGFPTANMRFGGAIVPSYGIYAVRILIAGEKEWRIGAANIGTRPMFEIDEPLLETHIFDFNGEIYGKVLKVRPIIKLRDEMKFDSLDALIEQIAKDCDKARNILQS